MTCFPDHTELATSELASQEIYVPSRKSKIERGKNLKDIDKTLNIDCIKYRAYRSFLLFLLLFSFQICFLLKKTSIF